MKYLIVVLLITYSAFCGAKQNCNITSKDLNFFTPKADNITNTFWKDSNEEGESVKRLYVIYKNGSTAIIKHRFCSKYKFEAVYYMEERERTNSTKKIKSSLILFLSYVAHKDSTQKEAIKTIIAELDKYTFVPDEVTGATYNGHDPAYGDTGYSILYSPMNHSSIHSSAISVEMGIGGIH